MQLKKAELRNSAKAFGNHYLVFFKPQQIAVLHSINHNILCFQAQTAPIKRPKTLEKRHETQKNDEKERNNRSKSKGIAGFLLGNRTQDESIIVSMIYSRVVLDEVGLRMHCCLRLPVFTHIPIK